MKLVREISVELKKKGTQEVRDKHEWYFKGVIKAYGIMTPEFKVIFSKIYKERIKELDVDEQKQIGIRLMESPIFEDKKFGIWVLEKIYKKFIPEDISLFLELVDNHVWDWATCDTFSSKIIGRMVADHAKYGKLIVPWKDHKNLWVQRAACISFLRVAKFGEHNHTIVKICSTVVQNPERFAQLGNGWILRELSLADLGLVIDFIRKNYNYFSREGLRYAIEKMDDKQRKKIMSNNF